MTENILNNYNTIIEKRNDTFGTMNEIMDSFIMFTSILSHQSEFNLRGVIGLDLQDKILFITKLIRTIKLIYIIFLPVPSINLIVHNSLSFGFIYSFTLLIFDV